MIWLLLACSTPPVSPVYARPYPERLSAWGLFQGAPGDLEPNEGVVPYALNSPLFTDYADKHRTLWLPPGAAIQYRAEGPLAFPEGAVLSKTFSYSDAEAAPGFGQVGAGARLVETRLMVNTPEGWVGLPYVWDADEGDATLALAGDVIPLSVRVPGEGAREIQYRVPDANQCKGCHETQKDTMSPIGPTAARLSGPGPGGPGPGGPGPGGPSPDGAEDQLAALAALGLLSGLPEGPRPAGVAYSDASQPLEARARAYLDVHCAHCHSAGGPADTSGLMLGSGEVDRHALGRCKAPVAAGRASGGRLYDIVPGQPQASILTHRLASEEPETMMPELGRSLAHREGVALIEDWIESMDGDCGQAPAQEAEG